MIAPLIVAAALRPTDGGSATDNQQDGPSTRPRLIVIFVVDQMRADCLDVFANRWKRGFATLRREIEDAFIRLDETIGTLINKLDADVGREHYIMALTSDHGVAAIPQTVGAARIATDDIRERIEETLVSQFGGSHSGAITLPM